MLAVKAANAGTGKTAQLRVLLSSRENTDSALEVNLRWRAVDMGVATSGVLVV